jgi:hypothetical protein
VRKLPAIAGFAIALIGLLSACTAPRGAAAPTAAPAPAMHPNSRSVSLTGSVTGGSGTVTGTFSVGAVRDQDGTLLAVGTFTGTVDKGGEATGGTTTIAIPVLPGALEGPGGSCGGLRLRLLPGEVSLLGVTVRFDPALIDILSAPVNLVGNLACQVTGLLRGTLAGTTKFVGGAATQLVGLLNQILGLLIAVV